MGLTNPSASRYTYARALDVTLPGTAFFTQPGRLWAAATADAAHLGVSVDDYLAASERAMLEFFESPSAEVAPGGREELQFTITKCGLARGAVTLLVGGKGTGKSSVLRAIVDRLERDNRRGSPLVVLLDGALLGPEATLESALLEALAGLRSRYASALGKALGAVTTGVAVIGEVLPRPHTPSHSWRLCF